MGEWATGRLGLSAASYWTSVLRAPPMQDRHPPSPRTVRRFLPDAAFLHHRHLLIDHLALIVGVLAWNFVEVAIFRIDRLLVDDLRQLGADVLEPIRHLRGFAVVAQRLNVDDAGD